MKYLLLAFLLIGCASRKPKEEVKPTRSAIKQTRQDKLVACVDRYLEKDVIIKEAYEVCQGIYKRG